MTIRHFVVVEVIILLKYFRVCFLALKTPVLLAIAVVTLYPFAFNNKLVLFFATVFLVVIQK
jgi:hypothetical protein